jgi:hypothetical protein
MIWTFKPINLRDVVWSRRTPNNTKDGITIFVCSDAKNERKLFMWDPVVLTIAPRLQTIRVVSLSLSLLIGYHSSKLVLVLISTVILGWSVSSGSKYLIYLLRFTCIAFVISNQKKWSLWNASCCVSVSYIELYLRQTQQYILEFIGKSVCIHWPTLVLRSRILLPWRWRRYVPPKRRSTQDLHSATSQKTTFFIVTAVKASNLTYVKFISAFSTYQKPPAISMLLMCNKRSWGKEFQFLSII